MHTSPQEQGRVSPAARQRQKPFVSHVHCARVAIFEMTCNENSTGVGVIMCADTTLM